MVEATCIVETANGIHARPSALLVETSLKFSSTITLFHGEIEADAKSIMSIMMLTAVHGSEIRIVCDGPDEEDALKEIVSLFESRFNQDS